MEQSLRNEAIAWMESRYYHYKTNVGIKYEFLFAVSSTFAPTDLAGKPQRVKGLPEAVRLRGDVHKHQAGMGEQPKEKAPSL